MKVHFELVNVLLEQVRIFSSASSFNKFWNTKVLSKWTNGVYSRNNLPITKDGAYVINLDAYKSIVTLRIALYVNAENVTCVDSFGVGHILKKKNK